MSNYTCDRCGACCSTFPIFVSNIDADREPKIKDSGLQLKPWLETPNWKYQLHPLPFLNACTFLDNMCQCTIYASRPNVCRELEPGSPQCQEARQRQGLKKLEII